jgi:hypothetical protein
MPELEHEFKEEKRCIKYAREAGYLMSVLYAMQRAAHEGDLERVDELYRLVKEYDRDVWRWRNESNR